MDTVIGKDRIATVGIGIQKCNSEGMNALLPEIKKVVPGFLSIGVYAHIFHFYKGGLRSPVFKKSDKNKIVKTFLQNNSYPLDYDGKIIFGFVDGEFTEYHCSLPPNKIFDSEESEGFCDIIVRDMVFDGQPERNRNLKVKN